MTGRCCAALMNGSLVCRLAAPTKKQYEPGLILKEYGKATCLQDLWHRRRTHERPCSPKSPSAHPSWTRLRPQACVSLLHAAPIPTCSA
eukprot:365954-Chlamydomonas_euryale.AAC.2